MLRSTPLESAHTCPACQGEDRAHPVHQRQGCNWLGIGLGYLLAFLCGAGALYLWLYRVFNYE